MSLTTYYAFRQAKRDKKKKSINVSENTCPY